MRQCLFTVFCVVCKVMNFSKEKASICKTLPGECIKICQWQGQIMSKPEIIFYPSSPKWVRPDRRHGSWKMRSSPPPPPPPPPLPTAPTSLPLQGSQMNPLDRSCLVFCCYRAAMNFRVHVIQGSASCHLGNGYRCKFLSLIPDSLSQKLRDGAQPSAF